MTFFTYDLTITPIIDIWNFNLGVGKSNIFKSIKKEGHDRMAFISEELFQQ